MSSERHFYTFAIELAVVNNIPYNGRLGTFNPTTQTFTTISGYAIYITPSYRCRLQNMLNELIKCDYD